MLLLANSGGEKANGSPTFAAVRRCERRRGHERIDLIPKANQRSLGELKGTIGDNLPFDGAGAFISEAPPPERKKTTRILLSAIEGFFLFCVKLSLHLATGFPFSRFSTRLCLPVQSSHFLLRL